jgi:eukaryotic-like serine/threonine-protein kinase
VPEEMSLASGTKLGPYEILAPIGAGGMGEVYRARDTKLDRDVAIKILAAGFTTDPERLVRFDREAKTLASLNHPNIAQIYGVEDAGATRAIVMELVEGEDLSQRIARGPMARPLALAIARQIAEAMQTAHDHGIIHRDLKPANVKVKADGTVKVLDFGLAKVADARPADGSLSHLPTMMTSMPGTVLGTAAYMSPEQVKGETADARSDVWAFGCLLFEMLTGRPAFAAATTSEILASVLKTEPDWRHLPPDTPESVRRLLRRSLEKNEANRLRAIADARLEIDDAQRSDRDPAHSRTATQSRTNWLVWATVVTLLGVVVLVLGVRSSRRLPALPEVRFDITTPEVADPFFLPSVALSPDGRQILFVADSDGQPHVWLRAINSVSARPLAGTGGAVFPFWSPDGRSIAFYADGFLKRLDLDGGLVRILAKAVVGIGGTWSRDGVILFVRNPASAIARVSAEGGPAVNATRLDTGQVGHTFPHFLPDGRHFLYYVAGAQDSRGIHVGQVDGSSSRRLLDADAGGVYTNGHLLFIRQTNVFAQEFDAERLELKGSPFQVADGALRGFNIMLSANAGAFAFRAGAARFVRQFTWVDRSGNQIATVGDRLGNPDGVSYSPDHSELVFFERGATSSQLWMLDIRRGLVSRFTDDADENIFPLWARDGNRIIYTAVRNGQCSLYQRSIGTGQRELLVQSQTEETFASDTSPDGRYIVYQRMNAKTGWDIWALSREPNATPIPVVQTDADERTARLSPDGRWIAFVSNASGVSQIYVQPFLGPGRPSQVSTKGGDQPQWRSDGAELFYLALDGRLTATSIKPAADHQSIDVGPPLPLFVAQAGMVVRPIDAGNYAASANGQRFLVNRLLRDAGDTPLRVVLNWGGGQ